MRYLVWLFPILVSACGSSAPDPCNAVPAEELAAIMGSEVTASELTGPRRMGDETVATCDFDFADKQWLTLTLARRDAERAEQITSGYRGKELDGFAFPVLLNGEKDLDAFPSLTSRVHLRIGRNAGGGYSGSTPERATDKLKAVLEKLPLD